MLYKHSTRVLTLSQEFSATVWQGCNQQNTSSIQAQWLNLTKIVTSKGRFCKAACNSTVLYDTHTCPHTHRQTDRQTDRQTHNHNPVHIHSHAVYDLAVLATVGAAVLTDSMRTRAAASD